MTRITKTGCLLLLCAATDAANVSVEDCLEKGFDPFHLACSTCDLLLGLDQNNNNYNMDSYCRSCCQSFRDMASLPLKPYPAAVLVQYKNPYGGSSSSLIDELLHDNDWEHFVTTELGGRLQVLSSDAPELNSLRQLRLQLSGELWFLEEEVMNDGKKISYESADRLAKERVSLRDLNKDDVRDMLKTLLIPPAESSGSSSWSFF